MNHCQRQNLPAYIRQQHTQRLQHQHQHQHQRLSSAETVNCDGSNQPSSAQVLSGRVLTAAMSALPSAHCKPQQQEQQQPLAPQPQQVFHQKAASKPARLKVFQDVTQQYVNNANVPNNDNLKDNRHRFINQKVAPMPGFYFALLDVVSI